ncbi:MAG: transcriptional repressor [Cyclobacteriaceae bacterium]
MNKYSQILEKHGIKSNSNRIAVFRQLYETEKAFSLCALSQILNGKMDRTTIYRILILFTEKKLVIKIPCSDGNTLFALKSGETENAGSTNFRCKCCQKVEKFPDLPEEYLNRLSQLKISLEAIAFEGYCRDCIG